MDEELMKAFAKAKEVNDIPEDAVYIGSGYTIYGRYSYYKKDNEYFCREMHKKRDDRNRLKCDTNHTHI